MGGASVPVAPQESSAETRNPVGGSHSDAVISVGGVPALRLGHNITISIDLSNSRAAGAGAHEMHTHLVVPARFAGMLIGKAGARFKHVKARTGCNLWMTPRDGGSERCVVIVGSCAQCVVAQSILVGHLAEAQNYELGDVTVILF